MKPFNDDGRIIWKAGDFALNCRNRGGAAWESENLFIDLRNLCALNIKFATAYKRLFIFGRNKLRDCPDIISAILAIRKSLTARRRQLRKLRDLGWCLIAFQNKDNIRIGGIS